MSVLINLYICAKGFLMPLCYNRIKEVLVRKKVSTLKLANFLNVSRDTASRWNRNENQPPISTLYQIAEFLGVEMGELLNTMDEIKKLHNNQLQKDK